MSDIQELFDRNPLDLTSEDLTELVTYFRAKRGQFLAGNLKAGSTKKPTEKQQAAIELGKSIGLELDL